MAQKQYKIILVYSILLLSWVNLSDAYDDKTTHRQINEYSANQPNLNDILINRIGLKDGIEEEIKGKNIRNWIKNGGENEDATISSDGAGFRYRKHFHDPLVEDWDSSGLSGTAGAFESALLWALDFDNDPTSVDNKYSWPAARQYFYTALTVNDREINYADMFRALGQIIHLVSDMAVPAHVRNDAHPGTFLSWFFRALD